MRIVVLILLFLPVLARGGFELFQDGKKIATCTNVETTSSTPSPPPDTQTVFTWSHETRGDQAPLNPQPLYDQTVLSPGQIYIEVLVGRVHHVDWFDGSKKLRTERVYPYTHSGTLSVGSYDFIAKVYSDDTTLIATHKVFVYVAYGGADAGGTGSAGDTAGDTTGGTGTHEVIVQWEPPTSRENGEALSAQELAGYNLLVNTDRVFIPAPANTHTLTLPTGQYVLTITALDSSGLESAPSEPVSLQL